MDEAWERAVEAALEGQANPSSELRVLNLDGAVKSLHGCLPPAGVLERFPGLVHLSIANVGALSLERFPRLRNLQRLILSDNRIAGGLESLVDAGLQSLRDLDLSNNRIQHIEDLAPLAALHIVSLDLYECPVTRVKDYRSKVFSMIRTLKYLDKLDANENERPESDEEEEEEEEDEEEEEYDEEEEDSGSGEVDGGDQGGKLTGGCGNSVDGDEGIVDADDDEGSDADEEEIETEHRLSNGFRVAATGAASVEVDGDGNDDVEDEDDDDDDDLGEEIDEDEAEYEDNGAAEAHVVLDSDEEDEDGVDEVEIDEDDGDEEVDEDDDEMGVGDEEDAEPASTGRLASTEGEIDGHDHGEEDENGEIGEEEEQGVEDRDAEEEDYGESEDEDDLDGAYVVQPIPRSSWPDSSVGNEEDEIDHEDENRPSNGTLNQASSSSDANKRRDEKGHLDDDKTEEQRPSKRR